MHTPPFPDDEAERLFSLQKMEILDTDPEERFDRITRTARRLFDVEICIISLVDETRQWFKSVQGIDVSETPRELSICGHTILSDEILVVEDTLNDPRFADNPLVVGGPKIRFYAGFPIQSPDGYKVGTLCLISPKPRTFSLEDRTSLRDLAEMVEDRFRPIPDLRIDSQTQLVNGLGFAMVGTQLLSVCHREKKEAQLICFELTNEFRNEKEANEAVMSFRSAL